MGLLACLARGPFQASAFSSASLFRDPGATNVWDSNDVYDSSDSTFSVDGTTSDVTVSMRHDDDSYTSGIEFAAPSGQVLQEGKSYPNGSAPRARATQALT